MAIAGKSAPSRSFHFFLFFLFLFQTS
jgi:hypothetical protein